MRKTIALLASLILLGACETAGPVTTDPCGPWRAMRFSRASILTPDDARQVLSHNETGVALRCWEPSR
mgnify:FL=1